MPTFCGVRWQQAEGRRVSSVREELLLLQPELRQGKAASCLDSHGMARASHNHRVAGELGLKKQKA